MPLTKFKPGSFAGITGAAVKFRLAARESSTPVTILGAAYDNQTVALNADGTVSLVLGDGRRWLTLVFAMTERGAWADLCAEEPDGSLETLRSARFDPASPVISVELEGRAQ